MHMQNEPCLKVINFPDAPTYKSYQEIASHAVEEICDFLCTSTEDPNQQREYFALKQEPLHAGKYLQVLQLINKHALLVLLSKKHWAFGDEDTTKLWGLREIELPQCNKRSIQQANEETLIKMQQGEGEF